MRYLIPGISGGSSSAPVVLPSINMGHEFADGLLHASYFDENVVVREIYRDLTGGNTHAMLTIPIQDYYTSTVSGDVSSHQGYTTDGTSHFTIDTAAIYKHADDANWTGTPSPLTSNTDPFASLEATSAHLGDGQYYSDGVNPELMIPVLRNGTTPPFVSQIAFYNDDTGLTYGHHVQIDTALDPAGLAYDPVTDEIYICHYYASTTQVSVYSRSECLAAAAGAVVTKLRTITLDVPAYLAQGIFYKDGELWISLNNYEILVYRRTTGKLQRAYRNPSAKIGLAGGNQGLDYSTDTLRQLYSGTTDRVAYFDLSTIPAMEATHDGTGFRAKFPYSLRFVYEGNGGIPFPSTGTIVTRVKVRSTGTRRLSDIRTSGTNWTAETYDHEFPVKFRAYPKAGTTVGFVDGHAQNTWYNLAWTWDFTNPSACVTTFVTDASGTPVQTVSTPYATPPALPIDMGIGAINDARSSAGDPNLSDHDVLYWYFYGEVKTLEQINAIHADPTAMIA